MGYTERFPRLQVGQQMFLQHIEVEEDLAQLAALCPGSRSLLHVIEVIETDSERLGDTQPGGDQQCQQGTVSQRREMLLVQQLRGAAADLVELLPGSPAAENDCTSCSTL